MILEKTNELGYTPERIISLVPSQTELLHHLELELETVGITRFCVYPQQWFNSKIRIGGTKTIDINAVHALKPDLIIANKEENVKEQIEELAIDYPVWVSDINNLDDALNMIKEVGELTGKTNRAGQVISKIKNGFENLPVPEQPLRSAYLIWQKPFMTVGGSTFINDMLIKCGFENAFAKRSRYPEVSIEELQAANCRFVLLSSEPYPFKQKHIEELKYRLTNSKIILVDGEMFSWYGSRLLQAPEYFKSLIRSIF